ncbi:MAG TPA: POTRA domain-containing protein [Pseudolabrys sp.]|nr:POTRA domain-containing protein [Pseudolabrys sp.]
MIGAGWAQQPAAAPRYDLRQTEKNIEQLQSGAQRAKPPVRLPTVPAAAVGHADTRPMFRLRGVSVAGAHVVAAEAIAETYKPFIGKTVSQADLVGIAVAITELYRTAGYALSRAIVPPQNIRNGRIHIKVIEGSITDFVLKGDDTERYGVRPLLARLLEEHPTQMKTLERQLMLVNEAPGIRVADTALEEIGRASGKFRLTVVIKTWRIYIGLGFDNAGASAVGPYQAFAATAFNSYFLHGDSLNLSASSTPNSPREFEFGRFAYDTPVGTDGARFGVNALYSNVAPGDIRQLTNTHTITDTVEVKGSVAPIETRKATLTLTGALDFSETWERDMFGIIYRDHIRAASLTADYRFKDPFAALNFLSVTGRQGFTIFGASEKDDLSTSRPNAASNFSVLDFSFARIQPLSDVWSVKVSANGQWASGPLLISQQFYLGDAAYGPGFYSGDSGIFAYGELRFDQPVSSDILKRYQLYGFFDKGAVWSFDTGGQILSIASAGAGIRFFFADDWQAGLGVAVPVHPGTTANTINGTRFLFSLSKSFKVCPQNNQLRCF